MRKLPLLAIGLLSLAIATPTFAQVQVRLRMGFPAVLPPLVEVEPGVSVVQDFDEEIFFTGGYYWVQRDGNWYRSRDHQGTWRYVVRDRLPGTLLRQQPGHYRRWQHDERRAWPEARERHGGRDHDGRDRGGHHWRAEDYRERQPQHDKKGDGHDGDRHEHEHR